MTVPASATYTWRGPLGTNTLAGMGSVIAYFRRHRLSRRILTLALAAIVGLTAAIVLYPRVTDWLLIRRLADRDPGRQAQAVLRAEFAAQRSQRFVDRLEAALETADDTQFAAVVSVLRRTGRFQVPTRDPLYVDRMRGLQIAQTHSDEDPRSAARTREMLLSKILLSGRKNRYVLKAMTAGLEDQSPLGRKLAALLAANYRYDSGLRLLMETDSDPSVVATAALAAGLAGRGELAEDMAKLLASSEQIEVVSAAAYSLAMLDPVRYSQQVCQRLRAAEDEALRDRLLAVAMVLADENARSAVSDILAGFLERRELPPAAAIAAGGKLRLAKGRRAIQVVVAAAADPQTVLRESQVIAAFEAAASWPIDVRQAAVEFCRIGWGPGRRLALMAATKAAVVPARPALASEAVSVLSKASSYSRPAEPQPVTGPTKWVTTPLPSAAAAIALWRISPSAGAEAIRRVAAGDQSLPGDYLAWHLGMIGGPDTYAMGLEMLPAASRGRPASSQPARIHNESLLSFGATLLALAARTPEQIDLATERIEGRLTGREISLRLRGTYRCALLILGQREHLDSVRLLLATGDFPRRRALTALLLAGDKETLDWLLAPGGQADDDVAFALVNEAGAEVLTACTPDLPTVAWWASRDLLSWQVRLLRYSYAIKRETIKIGLDR